MGNLTSCLRKVGSSLSAERKAQILKRSAALRADGVSVPNAVRQAVDELIAKVQSEIYAEIASPTPEPPRPPKAREEVGSALGARIKALTPISGAPMPGRPWLDGVGRIGGSEREQPVVHGAFREAFGFHEFGRWDGQDDRHFLEQAHAALRDLAEGLGIDPKALSAYGRIPILFAGSSAAIPSGPTVSITRGMGAGSILHEWVRAIDQYLTVGEAPTQGSRTRSPAVEAARDLAAAVMLADVELPSDPISAREMLAEVTKEQRAALAALRGKLETRQRARWDELAARLEDGDMGGTVMLADRSAVDGMPTVSGQRASSAVIDEMDALHREATKESFNTPDFDSVGAQIEIRAREMRSLRQIASRQIEVVGDVEPAQRASTFAVESRKMDGEFPPEWSKPRAMMARALESFVMDRLGHGGQENQLYRGDKPYPGKEDRARLAPVIERFLRSMERTELPAEFGIERRESSVYPVDRKGASRDIPLDIVAAPADGKVSPGEGRTDVAQPAGTGLRRDVQSSSGVRETVLAVREDDELPGFYHASTELVEVGRRVLPVDRVSNWQEAASALSGLGRYAVEHFDVLLTDQGGRPLAVVGAFKGDISEAAVYPHVILREAMRVSGATAAWGMHNHPSGRADLSAADINLSETINTAFKDSTVKWMGIAAIGDRRYSARDDKGDMQSGALLSGGQVSIPVVERTLLRGSVGMPEIDSPKGAMRILETVGSGTPGLMLLNPSHRVAAWLPMKEGDLDTLRGRKFDRLVNSLGRSNASRAILANPSSPGRPKDKVFREQMVRNLAIALKRVGVTLLDVTDVVAMESAAEKGQMPSVSEHEPLFSLNPDGAYPKPDTRIEGDIRAMVEGVSAKWRDGPKVSVVATERDLPEALRSHMGSQNVVGRAAGAIMPNGDVYLISSNIDSVGHAQFVLFHEVYGHFGLQRFLGADYARTMNRLRASNRKLADEAKAWFDAEGEAAIRHRMRGDRMTREEAEREVRLLAVEEALADRAGHGDVPGAFDQLLAALQTMLRRIGLDSVADWMELHTQAEVLQVLGNARRAVNGEKYHTFMASQVASFGAPAFSTHQSQTDTPAFKRWFGDSKVVDADGKPLMVYHGTTEDFSEFDANKLGSKTGAKDAREGFYFVDSGKAASEFTYRSGDMTGSVMPAYLSMQDPLVVNTPGEWMPGKYDAALAQAKREGHDGLIVRGATTLGTPGDYYIAFRPEQIKSATGNRGTFDATNQDIRYSLRDESRGEPTRRDLFGYGMGATAIGGLTGLGIFDTMRRNPTDNTTLGKAQPMPFSTTERQMDDRIVAVLRNAGPTGLDGTKAIRTALRMVAKHGPQEARALAQWIAEMMPAAGIKLAIDDKSAGKMHGEVNWEDGRHPKMTLFTSGKDGVVRHGLWYSTFLHEALHAVILARYSTLAAAAKPSNDPALADLAPDTQAAMLKFDALWREFRALAREQLPRLDSSMDAELRRQIKASSESMDEFFVRALTSSELQQWMSRREYQGESLWEKFKGWVKTTLFGGKSGVRASWLDAAFEGTGAIQRAIEADAPDFSRQRAIDKFEGTVRQRSMTEATSDEPAKYSTTGQWVEDQMRRIGATNLPLGYQIADLMRAGGGELHWWHRSVGTMRNLAKKNPLFAKVYAATENFIGDVSMFAKEAQSLAPTMLPSMDRAADAFNKAPIAPEDAAAIRAPLLQGTLMYRRNTDRNSVDYMLPVEEPDVQRAGIVWDTQELRDRFGLTDYQIGLYEETRAAIDKSLTDLGLSTMLTVGGEVLKPVYAEVMASNDVDFGVDVIRQHLGAVRLGGVDAGVEEKFRDIERRVSAIAEQTNRLQDRGYMPLSRFGAYTVDVVDAQGNRLGFWTFETKRERARFSRQIAEEIPDAVVKEGTTSEVGHQLFREISPDTLDAFGQILGLDPTGDTEADLAFQEMLRVARGNRSVMKRLLPRQGVPGYSQDIGRVLASFVYTNSRQASKNLHFREILMATDAIRRQVGEGQLLDAAVRLRDYIVNPREEAWGFRGLLFAQFLGGSVAAAAVNLMQPVMVAFPYLSQFAGIRSSAAHLVAANKAALAWEMDGTRTGDVELDRAMTIAEETGVVSPQETHQLLAQAHGVGALRSGEGSLVSDTSAKVNNFMARVSLLWGKPFAAAEQFNRRSTFIAAFRIAKEAGMSDPAGFATEAVKETQFSYTKANRPQWARGAVGSTLFVFKTFSISYVEMLVRMAKSGPEGRKAALVALGMLFLVSGIQGLPGADDLDDLIDGALQRLGLAWNTKLEKRRLIAKILGDAGADFVMRGASGLPGMPIDVAGRLGLGNLIPGTGLLPKKADYTKDVAEIAGPAGTLASQILTAGGKLVEGEPAKAAQAVMPISVANAWKAYDMATMGAYRDAKGKIVIQTDAMDALVKSLGFQPRDVARVQESSSQAAQIVSLVKLRETEIADRWAQGVFEGDQSKIDGARDELRAWNDRNPDGRIRITAKQILDRVKEMRTPRARRIEKTAPKEIRATVSEMLKETSP